MFGWYREQVDTSRQEISNVEAGFMISVSWKKSHGGPGLSWMALGQFLGFH